MNAQPGKPESEEPQADLHSDMTAHPATDFSRRQARVELAIGFWGQLLLVAAGVAVIWAGRIPSVYGPNRAWLDFAVSTGSVLAVMLNLAALILALLVRRPRIAAGMLLACAVAFMLLILVSGVFLAVACFTSPNSL